MPRKVRKEEPYFDPSEEFTSPSSWKDYKTSGELNKAIDDYFLRASEAHQRYYGEADLALGINVSLETLRSWKKGESGDEFKAVVDRAYLRIAAMFETNPLFNEDKVVARKALMMMKQPCFQGYQEKAEENNDLNIHLTFGQNVDVTDFE